MLEIRKVKGAWKQHRFTGWDFVLREQEGAWVRGEEAKALLHVLLQEGQVKEGSILLNGEPFSKRKAQVAWISGECVYPCTKLSQYIELLAELYPVFEKEWCLQALAEAEIEVMGRIDRLGAEERMYVEAVCAAAQGPRLLIVVSPYPVEGMEEQMEKALACLPQECSMLLFGEEGAGCFMKRITKICTATKEGLSAEAYCGNNAEEQLEEKEKAARAKNILEREEGKKKPSVYHDFLQEQDYDSFHFAGMKGGEEDETWRPQNDRAD